MIPVLTRHTEAVPLYVAACAELRLRGFEGDLTLSDADRTVFSTDNSIYQVAPGAVAFPRSRDDLVRIAKLLEDPRFSEIVIRPRGGATGTNGQSLGHGLVVDTSRHMNRILEIDVANRFVRVEPGVVKDQLNRELAKHGLFFAPELSTSNRATIGGMISTDACGQGSCLYGKTRDHVLALTCVLTDGTVWTAEPLDAEGFEPPRGATTGSGRYTAPSMPSSPRMRRSSPSAFQAQTVASRGRTSAICAIRRAGSTSRA